MKAIVKNACAAEAAFALAEMERLNIEALAALTNATTPSCARSRPTSSRRRVRRRSMCSATCGQERQGPQGARFLHGIPRQDFGVVAYLGPGGARGEDGIIRLRGVQDNAADAASLLPRGENTDEGVRRRENLNSEPHPNPLPCGRGSSCASLCGLSRQAPPFSRRISAPSFSARDRERIACLQKCCHI